MAAKYKVAVLGLGHWYSGYALARALQEHPRAELVAVAYDDRMKREEFATTFGLQAYSDYRDLLQREQVDIVHIAPPVADIPAYTIAAAQAGKHIILGKPMAMTLQQADEMIAVVQKAKVTCVPFQSLHRVRYAKFKEELDHGLIGDLKLMHISLHQGIAEDWFRSGRPGWFVDPSRTPGGALIDEGIYSIDRCMWLAGAAVSQVDARTANLVHRALKVEDWGLATLTFANGVIATLEASWTVTVPQPTGPSPKHNAIERRVIVGTEGVIVDDRQLLAGQARLTSSNPYWVVHKPSGELYGPPQPEALDYLIQCLEAGQPPIANMAAARDALAVALACYESARSGRPAQVVDK